MCFPLKPRQSEDSSMQSTTLLELGLGILLVTVCLCVSHCMCVCMQREEGGILLSLQPSAPSIEKKKFRQRLCVCRSVPVFVCVSDLVSPTSSWLCHGRLPLVLLPVLSGAQAEPAIRLSPVLPLLLLLLLLCLGFVNRSVLM